MPIEQNEHGTMMSDHHECRECGKTWECIIQRSFGSQCEQTVEQTCPACAFRHA